MKNDSPLSSKIYPVIKVFKYKGPYRYNLYKVTIDALKNYIYFPRKHWFQVVIKAFWSYFLIKETLSFTNQWPNNCPNMSKLCTNIRLKVFNVEGITSIRHIWEQILVSVKIENKHNPLISFSTQPFKCCICTDAMETRVLLLHPEKPLGKRVGLSEGRCSNPERRKSRGQGQGKTFLGHAGPSLAHISGWAIVLSRSLWDRRGHICQEQFRDCSLHCLGLVSGLQQAAQSTLVYSFLHSPLHPKVPFTSSFTLQSPSDPARDITLGKKQYPVGLQKDFLWVGPFVEG